MSGRLLGRLGRDRFVAFLPMGEETCGLASADPDHVASNLNAGVILAGTDAPAAAGDGRSADVLINLQTS